MAKRKEVARDDLLDAARRMCEAAGFHGFSIRNLADEAGISSASVHHHFPTKDDLGQAMLQRERESLNKALAAAGAEHEDWPRRRQEAVQLLAKARLPAVLMAEFAGLPPRCQAELRLLHTNMTGWLSRFATEALRRQELPDDADPEVLGNALMALAQGTALYTRLVHVDPMALLLGPN